MEPTTDFWAGLGGAISRASGEIVIAVIGIVAVLFVAVRWGLPIYKEIKLARIELDNRKMALEEKRQIDDNQRDIDRAKVAAEQAAAQENMARAMEGIQASNAILVSQISDSKTHSADMGKAVLRIDRKTDDILEGIVDLKEHLPHVGGTD